MKATTRKAGPPTLKFLTETEVQAAYNISKRTLQTWRLELRGPKARKFGKAVRYSVADIEAWIETLPTLGSQA